MSARTYYTSCCNVCDENRFYGKKYKKQYCIGVLKIKNPKVFISYSWDNPEHKEWVTALANELRKNGIDATIDEFITQRGTVNLNRMMIENIRDAEYTLVVLTAEYAKKADSFKGGVGYETSLLVNEMENNIEKIIPIIRTKGDTKESIPYYLQGVTYIDFSDNDNFCEAFEELKYKILKKDRIEMEDLGEIPDLKPRSVTMESLQANRSVDDDLIPDLREITDRDKNRFIKDSYDEIVNNLSELSEQTKQKNPNFDYEVDVVTNKKCIIRYYINGMVKQLVKIWIGSNFSREENILVSYGQFNIDNDSSCNEMIICEINEKKELKLRMTMNMIGNREVMDSKDVSIEIWKHIIQ